MNTLVDHGKKTGQIGVWQSIQRQSPVVPAIFQDALAFQNQSP